jgi:hypothetical protein
MMPSMDGRLNEPVTLQMSARVWADIDAGVDNAVSLAAQDGDEQVMYIGQTIRQAGWDQVPWVNGNWPPMNQIISIRLTRAQWWFAADEAARASPCAKNSTTTSPPSCAETRSPSSKLLPCDAHILTEMLL